MEEWSISLIKMSHGVGGYRIHTYLEMKVYAAAAAGGTHPADLLSAVYRVAFGDTYAVEVSVIGLVSVVVGDDDKVAVSGHSVARIGYNAAVCGVNRRSAAVAYVYTIMITASARTEIRGYITLRRPDICTVGCGERSRRGSHADNFVHGLKCNFAVNGSGCHYISVFAADAAIQCTLTIYPFGNDFPSAGIHGIVGNNFGFICYFGNNGFDCSSAYYSE